MRYRAAGRRGFTLPEILVAMVIMTMIAGVVSALYFASMRVWRRVSSQAQADPPAHMAIFRITKELKNAYMVDEIGDSFIMFTQPMTDSQGINLLPLQPGRRIAYYLSDESGEMGRDGTYLWRWSQDLSTGETRRSRLAENVEALEFSCDATSTRVLKIYAMSITVLGQEGLQQYRSRFEGHVAFRN